MGTTTGKCSKCGEECEVVQIEEYDIEEFWGSPVRRYYYEDVSECCMVEVEEDEPVMLAHGLGIPHE